MNLDYKISPFYGHKINQIITDSKISFDQFQTPGWSSMVKTEKSQQNKKSVKPSLHNKILQKLIQLQDNLKESKFSDIQKRNEENDDQNKHGIKMMSNKDNRGKRYNLEGNQQLKSQRNGKESRILQQRHNNREERFSIKSQQNIEISQSMSNSNISQRQSKPGMIIKNKHSESVMKFNKPLPRFNHITVHEHLYLNGKKLLQKKAMQVLFEQQYQKKMNLPFKPTINPKSQILAEVKYSRLKQKQELQTQLEEQIKQHDTCRSKKQTKQNFQQQKKKNEQNKIKIINNLFYFLSKNEQQITKDSIKDVIEQLPFMCIKLIQKLLSKLYIGQKFTWIQFYRFINNKQMITNKQSLINIYSKWYNRQKQSLQKSQREKNNQKL